MGLLIGVLILVTLSQVGYCRLMQLNQAIAVEKTIMSQGHSGDIPLHHPRSTGSSSLRTSSEEEEDEDTSKEMLQTTMFHLSAFLSQLYSRQQAVFEELFIDLSTPPPRG